MAKADTGNTGRRTSWIGAAQTNECPFPIQNLPYGVFSRNGGTPRVGVAIGDQVLDLSFLEAAGVMRPDAAQMVFDQPTLNRFMALPRSAWRRTRSLVQDLLDAENPRLRDDRELRRQALVPLDQVELHLPVFVRSFTDFYASRAHATHVGTMFRGPDRALNDNWLHMPIGYNGRASTVVVSKTPIIRPFGQIRDPKTGQPYYGPSRRLDLELELGAIVGSANAMGQRVSTSRAWSMIFGYVLLNDWSARDIQAFEYQPLGPFQSKAFATSISPWVISPWALEPFRVATPAREQPLLPYLAESTPYNFDIDLEIRLTPAGGRSSVISRTNARDLYYSFAQQLAHHTSSGCAMCIGDLLGSGTISGTSPGSFGSLLELCWNGTRPIQLENGIERCFLEDGDQVEIFGHCTGDGYRIGFGSCVGTIGPAWVA